MYISTLMHIHYSSSFLLKQDEAQSVCDISGSAELDNIVLALSEEVIDDFPVSDPRWAESIPAGQ